MLGEHEGRALERPPCFAQTSLFDVEVPELRIVPGLRFGIVRGRRFSSHCHEQNGAVEIALQLPRIADTRVSGG